MTITAEKRRQEILETLETADSPCSGTKLSRLFGVTRQVIVADIALLRAGGVPILATPRGYTLYSPSLQGRGVRRTIASQHGSDTDAIRDELYTIVDHGGRIIDVIVEHPVYGEIAGSLQIHSRRHADQFLDKLNNTQAEPLLVLTDGLHLHTIEADSQDDMDAAIAALKARGLLVE